MVPLPHAFQLQAVFQDKKLWTGKDSWEEIRRERTLREADDLSTGLPALLYHWTEDGKWESREMSSKLMLETVGGWK